MTTDEPRRPALAWLNYHHLLYFYTVAREGSMARASAVLHLTQPTVSSQIKALEEALGEKLFERRGRGLALTETGHIVYRYAEEIFTLGRELQDTLAGRPTGGGGVVADASSGFALEWPRDCPSCSPTVCSSPPSASPSRCT